MTENLHKCRNINCENTTKINRDKKYSTYCSLTCRRTHEEYSWNEFVNNAPKCNTPGCDNVVEAKKHHGNRTYTKTCSPTCLTDTRKRLAPMCKYELCDNQVTYSGSRQSYDVFCSEDCKKNYLIDNKNIKQHAAPKCKNPKCDNPTVPGNRSSYSKYCSLLCLISISEKAEKEFIAAAPECEYEKCNNKVKGEHGKYFSHCSIECFGNHRHDTFVKQMGPSPKCAEESCDDIVRGYHTYCSKECMYKGTTRTQRRKNTTKARHGYDYWLQNPNNFHNTKYKRKEYVFPSGKIYLVQGYEPIALDKLLDIYSEEDIIIGKNIPTIPYTSLDGKNKVYHPDIYIPKDNLLIEVKSTWTYSGKPEYLTINKLKEKAAINSGYKFKFMIIEQR